MNCFLGGVERQRRRSGPGGAVPGLSKQIIERATRIFWCGRVRSGDADRRFCFSLDGSARLKERTVVHFVLRHDAGRDRLCAFKLGACIKVAAVFAAAQVGLAFRALAFGDDVRGGLNEVSAHGTPHHLLKAGHPRRSRAVHRSSGLLLLALPRSFAIAVAILVALLVIFPSHVLLSASDSVTEFG